MLPTKILKLRLSRIAKAKEHLSTQDKLMLVSMESPDLSANFLLRLFKVSLPKQWNFAHDTEEDIQCATQLIQLIENDFIAAYEFHARKHAWYEQCLAYRLKFMVLQPSQQQIKYYIRQLEPCLDQPPKLDLLHYFQQHYPCAQYAVALAKAYAGAGQYTQAIVQYEWAAQHATQPNEVAFYGYIECLLNRNQTEYQPHVSDVEYALDLLNRYSKPIDQKIHARLIQRAVTLLLPESMLSTRASDTRILADVGRSLNLLGQSLTGKFGARSFHIPYRQDVIASAPQRLTDQVILDSLAQCKNMQAALQRMLTSEYEISEMRDAGQQLEACWRSIQANPEHLKLLTQPEQWLAVLPDIVLMEQHGSNLGVIQNILEQGLMAYLGDIRLDRQHPERALLYELREALVSEMTAFAFCFQQALKVELEQQSRLLVQTQALLTTHVQETCLASGLFAYQYEKHKRVQDLFYWLQQKLEKGNDFDKMQAAWVALREARHLQFEGMAARIATIQQHLENYKIRRLQQIWIRPDSSVGTPVEIDEN